jgi:hypothetical protein
MRRDCTLTLWLAGFYLRTKVIAMGTGFMCVVTAKSIAKGR